MPRDAGFDSRNGAPAEPLVYERASVSRIGDILPRPWAYGHFLLFGHAAVIGAVDGGGKGAMAVAIALSMITGRELLGEHVWRTGAVAIVSYEDDVAEWTRRIAAACLHYGLDFEDIVKEIHFISRPRGRVVFAGRDDVGGIVYPDGADIVAYLRDIEAALLIVDPFNHAHQLDDGNSNTAIARVAGEIERVAADSGVAGLVLHHLRKGSTGIADDLMGATSLRATFRTCRILQRMTEQEAKAFSMSPRERWRYLRISSGKENYSPPPDTATWYALESVSLDNPTAAYPAGDNVGVCTPWKPPLAFEGIALTVIAEIFDEIRRGPAPGEHYSPVTKAWNACAKMIAAKTGKTPEDAARIVKGWLDTQTLTKDEYHSACTRKPASFVILDETKAVAILGPLYGNFEPSE